MKYFPLQRSNLSVALCLFGEKSITPVFLLNSFREYIAAEDREVLDIWLRDDLTPKIIMVMMMMMCWNFSPHSSVFESPTKTTSDPSLASLPIKSSSRRGMCYIAGLLYWMCNDVNTASKHSRGLINSTKLNDQQRRR